MARAFTVSVREPGTYRITCDDDAAASTTYAVAPAFGAKTVFTSVAALFGGAGGGVLTALVMTIVVAVRRRRHRGQLEAGWPGYPPTR